MTECRECGFRFEVGDDVEIITSGLKGRIAYCDGTHTYFEVWLYGMGVMEDVPAHMMMLVGHETDEPPVKEEDNVVHVDFTKKVRMDKNTKTKGAA